MFEKSQELINRIRRDRPLVLNIMNYVAMDFVANGLLSLGASPVMSKAEQEIEDLLKHAKAVVINLGTLNEAFMVLCNHTCYLANQLNKPIILDPVGAGASQYRTDACLSLMNQYAISIIRGNASEVRALSGASNHAKGVDSMEDSLDVIEYAKKISEQYGAAVVISGKIDVIVDGELVSQLDRGSPLMPTVTGTGCLLSAVIGAFHAVEENRYEAAKLAALYYGICGESAAQNAKGPGSFRNAFLDALSGFPERGQYE